MPIYEYQCRGCAHQFETIQKISEAVLTECPSCGKHMLRKKISAVAFRLKGGGWYETDFKSGDKRNVAGTNEAAETKSSDSTAGATNKSESKDSSGASKSAGEGSSNASSSSSSSSSSKEASGKESSKEAAKPASAAKKEAATDTAKSKPKGGSTSESKSGGSKD